MEILRGLVIEQAKRAGNGGSPLKPDICIDCMTVHAGGRCGHNAEAKCVKCGLPVGYLWTGDVPANPGICWYCDAAMRSLGIGDLSEKVGPERRGVAMFVVRGSQQMVLDRVQRTDSVISGRLRVGRSECTVTLGPDGYTGRITIEGYPMVVVIDHQSWRVKFLN